MNLNYKALGEAGKQPLVILHGLFGSLDNWITLAKYFAEHFHVYLVDQRNHGKSPHTDDFSYQLMADDLREFLMQHAIQNPIILGHSMGGKTAMFFATQHPEMIDKLIVVDIAPKTYPVHHDSIIEGLKSLPLSQLERRGEADDLLAKDIPQFDTRQFLLKNLTRDENGAFVWKMNLPVIERNIEIIGHGLPEDAVFEKETLFIRGLKSDYIKDEDIPLLSKHFPHSRLESVAEAGHWVHAEAPQKLFDLVISFGK